MNFTEVREIPRRRGYTSLKREFEDFMATGLKAAKVGFEKGQYKSSAVAYSCMYISIKRHGFPIKIIKRGDEIYLVRTDM